jgi:hypothetical protein
MKSLLRFTVICFLVCLTVLRFDVKETRAAWQMFGGMGEFLNPSAHDLVHLCTDGVRFGIASKLPSPYKLLMYNVTKTQHFIDAHILPPGPHAEPLVISEQYEYAYYGYVDLTLTYPTNAPAVGDEVTYQIFPPYSDGNGNPTVFQYGPVFVKNCELEKLLTLKVKDEYVTLTFPQALRNSGSVIQATWNQLWEVLGRDQLVSYDLVHLCTDGVRIGIASSPANTTAYIVVHKPEHLMGNGVITPTFHENPVIVNNINHHFYAYQDVKFAAPQRTYTVGIVADNWPFYYQGWNYTSVEDCDLNQLLTIQVNNTNVSGSVGQVLTNSGSIQRGLSDPANDRPIVYTTSLGIVTRTSDTTWAWSYTPMQPLPNQLVTITADDQRGGVKQVTFIISVEGQVTSTPPPGDTPTVTPTATVTIGQELISNGGFEVDADQDQLPDGWQAAGKIKQVCNSTDLTKIVAFRGNCALQVKGSTQSTKLTQVINSENLLTMGTLKLSAQIKSKAAEPGTNFKVKISYLDQSLGSDKLELALLSGTSDYTYLQSDALILRGMPKKIKVKLASVAASGKHFVDDVSLKYIL